MLCLWFLSTTFSRFWSRNHQVPVHDPDQMRTIRIMKQATNYSTINHRYHLNHSKLHESKHCHQLYVHDENHPSSPKIFNILQKKKLLDIGGMGLWTFTTRCERQKLVCKPLVKQSSYTLITINWAMKHYPMLYHYICLFHRFPAN